MQAPFDAPDEVLCKKFKFGTDIVPVLFQAAVEFRRTFFAKFFEFFSRFEPEKTKI